MGFGFLNYINGFVAKSSDCVDFSAKEYSEADGEWRAAEGIKIRGRAQGRRLRTSPSQPDPIRHTPWDPPEPP